VRGARVRTGSFFTDSSSVNPRFGAGPVGMSTRGLQICVRGIAPAGERPAPPAM